MESEIAGERRASGGHAGWLALVIPAAISVVVHLIATAVVVVAGPRDLDLVMFPAWALASWWFARGAWLRTPWGRPAPEVEPPWEEPVLTERRAVWYVRLGAMSVIAAGLALAIQSLIAS